ncbi:MAG: LamG-like jellyroll fold domain-containing protein, partial [Thermoguttaceae bacterium]
MHCVKSGCILACVLWSLAASGAQTTPLEPFRPDGHTLLLYHFDEGQGSVAKDASGHGYDGEIHGAQWVEGRFGKALRLNGIDGCVFRRDTKAIEGLKQLTVECWFRQDNPEGRQFLAGKDITFHFDLNDGAGTTLSLYNRGASVANSEGLRHQQIGTGLGSIRYGKWHHLATTFDGRQVSFFLDGVLKGRSPGGKDFLLGAASRGLWVGSYVGKDYWFSGRIDEVRVSDCVRYDPENRLQLGQKAFDIPGEAVVRKAVRKPRQTGLARLSLRLKRLYGGSAAGWVALKSPGKPAVLVGRYDLSGLADQAETRVDFDVSGEWSGEGVYVAGLEEDGGRGYFAVLEAALSVRGKAAAQWSGELRSRRTFEPPILVPLRAGGPAPVEPARILLLPQAADRLAGDLDIAAGDSGDPPSAFGDGLLEYWVHVPRRQAYRFYLRYASPGLRPCDLVIDGDDLHPYHMAARNRSLGPTVRDALWEYQGTTTLSAGLHWIRLQDVLPEIVALRLEPVTAPGPPAIPWHRYAVPDGDFLARAEPWQVENLFGQPRSTAMGLSKDGPAALQFSTTLANVDRGEVFGGDCVRLVHRGQWDLEPFGRLRFRFQGQGSGHVASLWAVDLKGDEKLLWRIRDAKAGTQDVSVPISFEGNDVFDPGHVTAICLELDEGNVKVDRVHRFAGAMVGLAFDRRDAIEPPASYAATLARARQAMNKVVENATEKPAPLVAAGFRPWTKPVIPEEYPLYAKCEPKPVTRRTLGYELHCTGARDIGAAALDQFHKFYDFGDVCWPHIGSCPQRSAFAKDQDYKAALREMEKRLKDVRDRGLYVFDIWGYVPFDKRYPSKIAPEHHEILMRVLGDKFLGYDDGEQDGRYIGSYAAAGKQTNRREGWDDFVRWDEHICRDSMHYMNATGSLNFSHYYGERNCRLLGLETAQGLPSDTLMFAFLRGAGKQYGRLLTQATSIWNRFGYNMYQGRKTDGANGYGYGPNKGCSLSLH